MHPQPHPAMAQLERFIGSWQLAMTFEGFQVPGRVVSTFEWLEHGTLLAERTVAENTDGVPEELLAASPLPTTRVIGYDDTAEIYSLLYVDSRSVARVYQMRLTADRWEIWRDAPGFGQRYVGEFDADGRTIAGRWEKSLDNQTWELDFHLTYTKVT
jgi:hypothetical protein